jgi:hypothetical protein
MTAEPRNTSQFRSNPETSEGHPFSYSCHNFMIGIFTYLFSMPIKKSCAVFVFSIYSALRENTQNSFKVILKLLLGTQYLAGFY